MELINEINQIKKMMGLNLINEATVSWLDDLFTVSKSLISKYVTNKDGLEKLIKNGFNDTSFSLLKKRLSKDKVFGDSLIAQLEAAKSKLRKTDPNVIDLNARIDEIKDLQKNIPTKPVTPKPKTNTGGKTQAQIDKARQAKLDKQRAEATKLLSKQLNDEIYQLEKIVVDFENKNAKEVLKNPALKQKVRDAKNFLDDIKTKDLSVLSKYKQTQLNALEATIKNANPGVWSEITNFISKGWTGFRKLHPGIQALGVVLLVKMFGGKETGQILKKIWDGSLSLGSNFLKGLGVLDSSEVTTDNQGGSSTSNKKTYQGLDDNGNPIFK